MIKLTSNTPRLVVVQIYGTLFLLRILKSNFKSGTCAMYDVWCIVGTVRIRSFEQGMVGVPSTCPLAHPLLLDFEAGSEGQYVKYALS